MDMDMDMTHNRSNGRIASHMQGTHAAASCFGPGKLLKLGCRPASAVQAYVCDVCMARPVASPGGWGIDCTCSCPGPDVPCLCTP